MYNITFIFVLSKYNTSELNLLVQRKNQIGKRRLVKDAYLRDVLEPEKITPIREYKDKYVKEKKFKLPEPLPKAQADKILKEKPLKKSDYEVIKEEKVPKEKPVVDLEARREAKNSRQREAYVSVKKERVKPEPVIKESKAPAEKRRYPRIIRPFSISTEPGFVSFD